MTRTWILALCFAGACGGSAPAPAAPSSTPPEAEAEPAPAVDPQVAAEVADAFVEVLATMAQITTGPSCPAMGEELRGLFDRSAELFDHARALARDPEASKLLVAAMEARAAEVAPLIEAMGPGLVRCREDATVQDAMARMPTLNL
ncbi:MAG: hypothetical protein IPL61_36945 [Myxococcales bacterium]|nr:hypothetical protein [Myxococcales bacterium]